MRYVIYLFIAMVSMSVAHAQQTGGAVRGVGTNGMRGLHGALAKFEPEAGRVYHGVGGLGDEIAAYDALMDSVTRPYLVQIFYDLPGTGPQYAQLRTELAAQKTIGRFPVLSLDLTDGVIGVDSLMATTSNYNAAIDSLAKICREYGSRIFIRPGFEFSNSWNGYHPYLYPRAFQKIVDRFRAMGAADSAAFIWCYYPGGAGTDFDSSDARGARWYPGDSYVDWFGVDLFFAEEFDVSLPAADSAGITLRGKTERFLDAARRHGKPVIAAEVSAAGVSISSDLIDGDDDWFAWFDPFFSFLNAHPEVKGFCYMNAAWNGSWGNARIDSNANIVDFYKLEMENTVYIHLPTKTTPPPTLAAPRLRLPANGSTLPNGTVGMEWEASPGATLYHVQIASEPGFGTLVADDSTVAQAGRAATGLAPGTYYWHVRARNQDAVSPWSETWAFTVQSGLPAQVLLASPAPGALIADLQTRLAWNPANPQVDRYWVEVAENAAFNGATVDSMVTDTATMRTGLIDGKSYWWRVRAHNPVGWGPFSSPRLFTIQLESSGVEDANPAASTALLALIPNPARTSATVRFRLAARTRATLAVYDELGRPVAVVADANFEAGVHTTAIDVTSLSTGTYLLRLVTTDGTHHRVLHVMR